MTDDKMVKTALLPKTFIPMGSLKWVKPLCMVLENILLSYLSLNPHFIYWKMYVWLQRLYGHVIYCRSMEVHLYKNPILLKIFLETKFYRKNNSFIDLARFLIWNEFDAHSAVFRCQDYQFYIYQTFSSDDRWFLLNCQMSFGSYMGVAWKTDEVRSSFDVDGDM